MFIYHFYTSILNSNIFCLNGLIEQWGHYPSDIGSNKTVEIPLYINVTKAFPITNGIVTSSEGYRFTSIQTTSASSITIRSGGDYKVFGAYWFVIGY